MSNQGLRFGPAKPFSYDWLKIHAGELAQSPYVPPPQPDPAIVAAINYDAYGQLKYKPEFALYGDGQPGVFPITFMFVGHYFPKTVRMYSVEKDMNAREILYDPQYFDIPAHNVAKRLPARPSCIAGFWVREAKNGPSDWRQEEPWLTFLGASYFRAKGELGQVGVSARGIALTPGGSTPEEFPDFIAYWFLPAETPSSPLECYALLDGPSVTGAYRFLMRRTKGAVMDIEATLFFRKPVERLGLGLLTSMYWYSETMKLTASDWRPEVHDSDGLVMWNGAGERLWRPLNNPPRIVISGFQDNHARGFGLLQRDRNFDHYLDGVAYEKRPSVWVEPLSDWGSGAIHLVEIPTGDEINDNIVAYWCPAEPVRGGDKIEIGYRLHWLADQPHPPELGRCIATRLGRGGQRGQPHPPNVRKFVVEFLGGPLLNLPAGIRPEAVLWTSRGKFSYIATAPFPDGVPGHWLAEFDLVVDGKDPVELRLYLKTPQQIVTETWLYQYHPFSNAPMNSLA
ncbi:MAG: glucan biosynthesis protein D [Verrucomicrobia bacterium]|nr:glucan biosynthesis protein D [Verrucomicrobiota bacterium]